MKHDGPFRPGDFCGEYQIVGSLGKGGFGTVYEALPPHKISSKDGMGGVGRRVALKCLQLDAAVREDQVERLKKAARLLMHLRHPNIVSVIDSGTAPGGIVYFVMERLYGASLREVARRERPMPISKALRIVSEVGDGLAHASEVRVVHRNLKPENIFVTTTGEVKILDFSNARYAAFGAKAGNALRGPGMAKYLAPEQIEDLPDVDQRADIFALATIAHELLSDRSPFTWPKLTHAEVRDRQLSAAPEGLHRVNPEVPPHLAEVIATAMAADRGQRYQTTRAFVRALRDATRRYEAKSAGFFFRSNDTAPAVVVSTAGASSLASRPVLETDDAHARASTGESDSLPPLPIASTALIGNATSIADHAPVRFPSRSRWWVLSLGFAIGLAATFGVWILFSQAPSDGPLMRRNWRGMHIARVAAATHAATLENAGALEKSARAARQAESATTDSSAPARSKREAIAVDDLPVDESPEEKKAHPKAQPVTTTPEPDFFRTMGDD